MLILFLSNDSFNMFKTITCYLLAALLQQIYDVYWLRPQADHKAIFHRLSKLFQEYFFGLQMIVPCD